MWLAIDKREVDEVDTFKGPAAVLYRPGEDRGELCIKIKCNRSVMVAVTSLPIGYSVTVAVTGLPIGYSVIVALL